MKRRSWLASVFGTLAARAVFPRGIRAERLRWDWPGELNFQMERHYRADAQVLLLGISIFHREGVGGGHAAWREWREGAHKLEFAGYSLPDRAAGLNRLGFIRELSQPTADGGAESLYFGLMTASPEESADEARKALHSDAQEALYTAIEGRISPGNMETSTVHFKGPARLPPGQWEGLESAARKLLTDTPLRPADFVTPKTPPPPFLHALASVLRDSRATETQYCYGGRLYWMRVKRSNDEKATALFRQRGLVSADRRVQHVSGEIQRVSGGKAIEFSVWVEENAPRPIPLRIDYRAKAYLRLTFEAVG